MVDNKTREIVHRWQREGGVLRYHKGLYIMRNGEYQSAYLYRFYEGMKSLMLNEVGYARLLCKKALIEAGYSPRQAQRLIGGINENNVYRS